MILAALGAAAILAGAGALYIASPQQCAFARALPRRLLGWSGGAAILAGQVLLLTWAGPAAALFIGLTLAMTAWTLAPLLAGWRRSRQGAAP